MAFLRTYKKKSGTYLRTVRSFRGEVGKDRHQTLVTLGKAEDYSTETLKKMGQALYKLGGGTLEELEHRMFHEIASFNYGFVQVIRQLLDIYGLGRFFDGIARNKSPGFSFIDCVTLMVSQRLHAPVGKYPTFVNQQDYFGLEPLQFTMELRLVNQNDKEYYSRSNTPQNAMKIVKALKIRQIPEFTPKEPINHYFKHIKKK